MANAKKHALCRNMFYQEYFSYKNVNHIILGCNEIISF